MMMMQQQNPGLVMPMDPNMMPPPMMPMDGMMPPAGGMPPGPGQMPAYNPQMGGDKPMPGLNSDPNPGPTNPLPPAPPG